MKALATITSSFVLLSLLGCSDPPPSEQRYAIQLHAALPTGEPLAGARFWLMGHELGPTERDGRAAVTLSGHEGDLIKVSTLCPVGLRGPKTPRAVRLQHVAAIGVDQAAPLAVTVHCEPEQAQAALVVRVRSAGRPLTLPIIVDGRRVGQTDADGIAHVLVHGAPRSSLQVRLDTTAQATLTPHSPVRLFDLEDSESILLFDQVFDRERATPRHSYPRPAPPARPRAPYRIE